MCGIAGILERTGRAVDLDELRSVTRAVAHRGPDGEGFHVDGPLALGHRRLSILDLSDAGRQPMADDTGRYHITYNGEVYNYVELRAELEGRGHAFRSHSDTEVLLHAFREWGPECLPRLNGMFAFAIWDAQARSLFCARDRFGIKPFFYLDRPDRFLFGSELKQLLLARDVPRRPNLARLSGFLAAGVTDDGEDTFFADLRMLRPGHWLLADARGTRTGRWWHLPPPPDPLAPVGREHVEEVRALLTDAVRLRLRSDVPVGSCLSGGVDSNAVLCLMAQLLEGRGSLQSFTAVFDDPRLDESRYHEAGRERARAEWRSVRCAGDVVREALPAVVRAHDEPFASTGPIAQYLVNELARASGVTVLLNGNGSDEIFAGYRTFFAPALADLVRGGRLDRLRRELLAIKAARPEAWPGLGRGIAKALAAPRLERWRGHVRRGSAPGWMGADLKRHLPAPVPTRLPDAPALYQAHERALEAVALPQYLRHEDRNSMASSIESRLPFMDFRLVTRALTLPDAAKVHDGWTKKILRDALRGVVPAVVLERRDKMGFPTPQVAWLRNELAPHVAEAFVPQALARRGLYDVDAVERLHARWQSGDDGPATAIWRITSVDLWSRAWGL